jgi:transcriptional regulator with XRE-family HTH domain
VTLENRSDKNNRANVWGYRIDLINAAMGASRMTNGSVAAKAGVSIMTVSRIRNGDPSVGYLTLKKVIEAVGLTMPEVSTPDQ